MGVAGGLFLGTIVFAINFDHGVDAALVAALKQAAYTFLAGGTITRFSENLASYFTNKYVAITLAILIPSCIAVGLTFLVHSLKGTPEPLNSTIPTMILAPLGFLWWSTQKRKQLKTIRD